MHAQPKILQAEFSEVFPSYDKRIKVVLLEISPKLALPLLVFAPQKTEAKEEQRYDDRRDDIDREFALQGVDHITNISFAAVTTGSPQDESVPCPNLWSIVSGKAAFFRTRLTEPWLQRVLAPSCAIITDFQQDSRA